MKDRREIFLTLQTEIKKSVKRAGEIACDETLFEQLRALRRKIADERSVPPYVIFADTALRHMAREYPTTTLEFSRIPGVGTQKLAEFAAPFTAEIREYLATHNKQTFARLAATEPELPAIESKPALGDTARETLRLFNSGLDPAQIAERRSFVESTIWSHLASAVAAGQQLDMRRLITEADENKIRGVLAEISGPALAPAKEKLGDKFTYGQIRLVAAAMGRITS